MFLSLSCYPVVVELAQLVVSQRQPKVVWGPLPPNHPQVNYITNVSCKFYFLDYLHFLNFSQCLIT